MVTCHPSTNYAVCYCGCDHTLVAAEYEKWSIMQHEPNIIFPSFTFCFENRQLIPYQTPPPPHILDAERYPYENRRFYGRINNPNI